MIHDSLTRKNGSPMNSVNRALGASLAAAAVSIALATIAQVAATVAPVKGKSIHRNDEVHCFGVNACKGQSDCETATNGCMTQNSCKGKGWKKLTAARCFARRGFIGDVF
jgi:uncharacterized membrane protein